jgi:hypothetical protein
MIYMPIRYKDDVMLILNTEATLMFVAKEVGGLLDVFDVTAFDECLVDRFYNDTNHLMGELKVYPVEEEMSFKEVMNLNEEWFLDHILGGYQHEK